METVKGYIEKIVYRNADNGYTVLSLSMSGEDSFEDEITCVGYFAAVDEGEFIEASGEFSNHSLYGEQLNVDSYSVKSPDDIDSIRKYLGAGSIKGLGEALADRIVRKFGLETFEIMEKQPERLAEVKGISTRKAMEIADQVEEKKDLRQAMIFLQKYGVSLSMAVKIYEQYGSGLYAVIRDNPYKMADEIAGIGFKAADEIAKKVGIQTDSHYRIKSGILYVLLQASSNGDVYLPMEDLTIRAKQLLEVESGEFEKNIMDLILDKRIIVRDEDRKAYVSNYYYTELNSAKMLHDLNVSEGKGQEKTEDYISKIEKDTGITLDELQKTAVMEAAHNGFLVITGGPGTGKTTTINAIIKYFSMTNHEILLAAPTGRAAKRMTEATGLEAQTIHRLLEISGNLGDSSYAARFERNEENPLEADVVIIDEASMVDMFLMHALLKAVTVGTRLILVGDVNQLPSVGPGNVLQDILECGCFKVVRLTKIFRQAQESDIVLNAHKINCGEKLDLKKPSKDFLFIKREDSNKIIAAMLTLILKKLPEYVECDVADIQVLTPMRKGMLGVERLNKILQDYLNPKDVSKREKEFQGIVFREGDKVMQIKNNYQLEWEMSNRYGVTVKRGMGIFNGDMGIIRTVNTYAEVMEVEFDEGRLVSYSFRQLDELEPAYAITIHKAQGSEYPAVVVPVLTGPRMLMNRNILYTAVTRAKKCVCLLGDEETIWQMTDNKSEQIRYSGLGERLKELKEGVGQPL
ncbi:SF1B family DNA helicase RecD2 [Parasporobacterium paucivorans]|uniref:ATP-dependent RecD2 DNA helicase n=1 Tax=Parasporobacterium paucivorans DSM 15970 TaxID=1122934 RepID=A0A1M6BG41_9FIRM|nr:ATP-dependent RecD-like DNA helicase [Parasporobacterium paucivorans]SHI47679.1 exodeoxyribonuclease V alpha subunit [Parasporobacterium paucivorans DSM 15970]